MIDLLCRGLGDVRDLLYDLRGSHLVTYADTRFAGSGEVPVERVLTNSSVYDNELLKRQCLDYMLFFPGQNCEVHSSCPEPLVPATCQVEKFLVDRAKDIGAPVTQLSDHYGLEATIAVIASQQAQLQTNQCEERRLDQSIEAQAEQTLEDPAEESSHSTVDDLEEHILKPSAESSESPLVRSVEPAHHAQAEHTIRHHQLAENLEPPQEKFGESAPHEVAERSEGVSVL